MQTIVKAIKPNLIYDIMSKTPLNYATILSEQLHNNIYLKREDLTPVHSFKLRGAYHKIAQLSKKELATGILTSSAGNHAQGVALAAKKMGTKATIVMPKTTPEIKINAVKSLGAKIILAGEDYDHAYQQAQQMAKKSGKTFIHAFDDINVIAGQATVALELLEQLNHIDYIFVPVGGGGLITGIASVIKTYKPSIKVIGVEPINADAFTKSLKQNKQIVLEEVDIFAEGVAVKQVGKYGLRLARKIIDGTILVSNDQICAAIKDIYQQTRGIVEPSGALSLAGVKNYIEQHKLNKCNIVSILSGANLNFDRLRYIAERAEIGEQKERIFAVTIPEQIGSFLAFCKVLSDFVITEFNYRYASDDKAYVFVGIAIGSGASKAELDRRLSNYQFVDMSDNELAKTHIRYMVGGRFKVADEIVYRLSFPEKPGALLNFLQLVGDKWNISLFHYRNHGSDYGRVLVGFTTKHHAALEKQLDELGYAYHSETSNIAYQHFLTQ